MRAQSFPFLCYQLLGNNEAVANTTYRSGIRCRYMVPETRRLVRILFGQQQIADKTLAFRRLPVFELRDAHPFVSDVKQMLGKAVNAMAARLQPR